MRKFGIFLVITLMLTLLAGLYGSIHDQITYTISNEYFTKFKYTQFGFEPAWFSGHRPTVAVIGFLATWWVGLIIGLIFGLLGLFFVSKASLVKTLLQAIRIVFSTTVIAGVAGYFYGRFYLAKTGVSWWLPTDLQHPIDFITVGSIHNFGYIGGIAGLLGGTVYILRHRGLPPVKSVPQI